MPKQNNISLYHTNAFESPILSIFYGCFEKSYKLKMLIMELFVKIALKWIALVCVALFLLAVIIFNLYKEYRTIRNSQ